MIGKIITILAALAEVVMFVIRQRRVQQQEREIEKAKQEPAEWFDDHFNGQPAERVPVDEQNTAASVPADAIATGKASTAKPDKN